MSDNAQLFTGRVTDYDQFRMRYDPEILLPRFRAWCGLSPQWIVADIGAGTGMLADTFLANGNNVLAVEPNEEMRRACAELHANNSKLEVIDGAAEAVPLPAKCIDLISVGRSFHWFDADRAIPEFRRILKSEGWIVGVVYGRAQEGTEANVAVETIVRASAADQATSSDVYAKHSSLPKYLVRDVHHEEIKGTMSVTEAQLLGLLRSISHAPRLSEPRYSDLERGIRDVFAKHAVGGLLTLATRYWIDAGRLA